MNEGGGLSSKNVGKVIKNTCMESVRERERDAHTENAQTDTCACADREQLQSFQNDSNFRNVIRTGPESITLIICFYPPPVWLRA